MKIRFNRSLVGDTNIMGLQFVLTMKARDSINFVPLSFYDRAAYNLLRYRMYVSSLDSRCHPVVVSRILSGDNCIVTWTRSWKSTTGAALRPPQVNSICIYVRLARGYVRVGKALHGST